MEYIIRIAPSLLEGTVETLKIFSMTLVLALPLGLVVSFLSISKFKPFKWIATVYIWVFRGTPLLLQLFFFYYALPIMQPFGLSMRMDRFVAAVVAFVLNYAAYFSEIYRSGIESVDKGQFEAAYSLSYSKIKTFRYIILPQVFMRIIPPISNEVITLVKDTALVISISVPELLKSASDAANRDVDSTAYVLAAGIYLSITLVLTMLSRILEKRFSRHEREAI